MHFYRWVRSFHLHLGLPSVLFPVFFPTNILCRPYLTISDTCPADLSSLNLIALRSEDYKWHTLFSVSLHIPVTASLQTASSTLYFHNHLFSSLRAGILNQ